MVRQNKVWPYLIQKWYSNCRAVRTDGAAHGYRPLSGVTSTQLNSSYCSYNIVQPCINGALKGKI